MLWTPVARRRRQILVDVDTQNHFFRKGSPLCVDDPLSVLHNIRKVFAWARNEHVHIVSTVQVGHGSALYADSFPPGGFSVRKPACVLCRRRTLLEAKDCTDLPGRVVEHYQQIILEKRSFDPFDEPRSDRFFTELQAEEFIVIGAPLEGAVRATVLGLLARGKHVTLIPDAIGSFCPPLARKARQQMKAKGARFGSTARLVGALQAV